MARWTVAPELRERDCVYFAKAYIEQYDLERLGAVYLRYRFSTYFKGVWGWCYPPGYPPGGKTELTQRYYRISCSLQGTDHHFPYEYPLYYPVHYGGGIRPECVARNVDEVVVCNFGHEMYHYLAATHQINGHWRDERAAVQHSFKVLEEYRKERT